ncbi:MAG: type II secretion system major pseudopilin GspG [Phycisphaerae bacterium]|nr:type II secretion system major pseudopilin GspG [Phycisphaerae bacterium]
MAGRRKQQRRRGFTLIEVLLVAGILALLAAFAIPRLFGQARQAQIKIAEAQVGRNGPIGKALEAYKWDMGRYPETDEGLAALYQKKDQVDDARYTGPYLEGDFEELKDPWGAGYEYRSPGDVHEDGYDLWSRGPDGKDDGGKEGSDDIKNWIEK